MSPTRHARLADSSDSTRTVHSVNEAHFAEIEKVLLYISEARRRAENVAKMIAKDGAEEHLVEALEEAERELEVLGRTLMQRTYFAVPKEQLTL
jgi:ACT domain-containing protein